MYGKTVKLNLGEDTVVEVFVFCAPDTTDDELESLALNKLETLIGNRKFEKVSGIKV